MYDDDVQYDYKLFGRESDIGGNEAQWVVKWNYWDTFVKSLICCRKQA